MHRYHIHALSLAMLLGLGATSCEKYNEVAPPRFDTQAEAQEKLPLPTHTISQLKELYQPGGVVITKPIVISAVIISDDSEGNLYKTCYIQDETGGMELKFALGNLSSLYPQGTRVRLLCQDLKLGRYGGHGLLPRAPCPTLPPEGRTRRSHSARSLCRYTEQAARREAHPPR